MNLDEIATTSIVDRTARLVWQRRETTHADLAEALLFMIAESWDGQKKGLTVRNEVPAGCEPLPQSYTALIGRVSDAYSQLEVIRKAVESTRL